MKLQDILQVKGTDVHTISSEATLAEVVRKLVDDGCGSLVVCSSGQMVGIITERDILRACAGNNATLHEIKVSVHMTSEVISGSLTDSVEDTMGLMTKRHIRHLPVI